MGTKVLLIALVGAASASLCAANENGAGDSSQPNYTVSIGQGGYIRLPDLRPAPASYALTGDNQYRQTQRVWEAQAGVSYSVGNGRIVIPQAR